MYSNILLVVAGMIYNGTYYLYEKNALGDVYRIRDANGTELLSYNYGRLNSNTEKTLGILIQLKETKKHNKSVS